MPDLTDVQAAADRIQGLVHYTPVLTSERINEIAGTNIFFKCENLQKAGAFKARGASNAVFGLGDAEAAKGVATHSSGKVYSMIRVPPTKVFSCLDIDASCP